MRIVRKSCRFPCTSGVRENYAVLCLFWPTKWKGPAVRTSGNEIAIETLEIAHEGLELEAVWFLVRLDSKGEKSPSPT